MGRAFKVVILGGGTAAGYAACEFVKLGIGHGDLCIISDESVAPYERPALSKGFLFPEVATRLPAFHTCVGVGLDRQTPKWYKDHGVELVLDTPVIAADVKQKTLLTAAGETILYQTLIVATGARALRLEEFGVTGADAHNICYLRNLKDATKLVDTMAALKGGRAVVIGGGYIGMECAAALVRNKIPVTLVFPESHCMGRLFTPQIATFYEDYYKKQGVVFIKGTFMTAFEHGDDGQVTGVILRDGSRLLANLVVVGIGIRANTSLFEGQLAIEKGGIKVNGKMRTSNSSVYAVGDVAAFPVKMYGHLMHLEHVDHARKSAAHAVHAIMQPDKTPDYDYLPFFYSRVFTLSWQFFGANTGDPVYFGEPEKGKFGTFYIDKGRLVGVFLEGGTKEEYVAMAKAARMRPVVEDRGVLAGQGIGCIMALLETGQGGSSIMSSITGEKEFLQRTSSLAVQASAGLAVAVTLALVAYWYGRRRRRWQGQ